MVSSGLTYGAGENIFHFLFKVTAVNILSMIHATLDHASLISALSFNKELCAAIIERYYVVIGAVYSIMVFCQKLRIVITCVCVSV